MELRTRVMVGGLAALFLSGVGTFSLPAEYQVAVAGLCVLIVLSAAMIALPLVELCELYKRKS